MNTINKLMPAKEMENVMATSANIRFQDFEMRTYSTIENHARQGYTDCAKVIDIPYGIAKYNHNMSNFIEKLREAGYYTVVARKDYKGARHMLHIAWTEEGKKNIDDYTNSRGVSVYYYGGDL